MDGAGRFAGPEWGPRLLAVARALLGRGRRAAKPVNRDMIVAPQRKSRALFLIERLTPRGAGAVATLLILGGSAVFGAITGAAQARITLSPEVRALLLAGLLGGFTTFSSYMNESVVLVRDGQFLWAAINLGGQVVVGFVAFSIAYAMASFR